MTATTFAEHDGEPVDVAGDRAAASGRWRSGWRIHSTPGSEAAGHDHARVEVVRHDDNLVLVPLRHRQARPPEDPDART